MNATIQTDIRRILLALEPAGIQQASLDLALQLARMHGAELAALLIEDMNLLRAAGLPFAREITWSGAEERKLDPEHLARRLRAEIERVKEALARQAESIGVRWSLQSLQAHDLRAALTAIKKEELMILGRLSRTPWSSISMPSRIILLYTGTEKYGQLELVMHRVAEALGEAGLRIAPHAVWEGMQVAQPALVLSALRTWRPALVVALADVWDERADLLRELLDQIECPLVITGK